MEHLPGMGLNEEVPSGRHLNVEKDVSEINDAVSPVFFYCLNFKHKDKQQIKPKVYLLFLFPFLLMCLLNAIFGRLFEGLVSKSFKVKLLIAAVY